MLVSPGLTFLSPARAFSSISRLSCSGSSGCSNNGSFLIKFYGVNKNIWAPILQNPRNPQTSAAVSKTVSTQTRLANWEEPDDGNSSSDEDDDDHECENELQHYEDNLWREIEELLTPEERAILEQNEAPNISKISMMKWELLHTLALSGQIPFMDKLLEQGVGIDVRDKDGFTALHKSVIGKKEAVVSHLLRKGANPNVQDKDGVTPLHYAVQVGAFQTVKLLIKYKVDVNVADDEGWTPLHVAIQGRNRDIAKVLLVNGADKTRRTKDGKTALDLCLCYGKDFKSYDLAKLVKLVPADRDC